MSVCFYIMRFKKYQKEKKIAFLSSKKKGKPQFKKRDKSKTEGVESAVCVVGTLTF